MPIIFAPRPIPDDFREGIPQGGLWTLGKAGFEIGVVITLTIVLVAFISNSH